MKDELKQSRSVAKTTGSKDAKALKHNPNRSLEAPAMPDMGTEISVKRAGDGHKGDKVVERVIELARLGMSITQIAQTARVGRRTIYDWRDADPDFREALEQAYSDYVDEAVKTHIPFMEKVFKSPGYQDDRLRKLNDLLKPETYTTQTGSIDRTARINAIHSYVNDGSLLALRQATGWNMGMQRLFDAIGWREKKEEGTPMVVLDVQLGASVRKFDLPGTAGGQNAEALEVDAVFGPGAKRRAVDAKVVKGKKREV